MILDIHPLCELYPDMPDAEIEDLAKDIKANGQRESIWTFEGKILDGKNRLLACEMAMIPAKFKEFTGTRAQAIAFVKSKNLLRRHLTAIERAKLNPDRANAKEGRQKTTASSEAVKTQAQEAEELGVSRSTIQRRDAAEKPKLPPEPKKKLNAFEQAKEDAARMREIEIEVRRLGKEILEIAQTPIGRHLSVNSLTEGVERLKQYIRWGFPNCLCVYCGGDKCKACLQTGWMTLHEYNAAPKDLKK